MEPEDIQHLIGRLYRAIDLINNNSKYFAVAAILADISALKAFLPDDPPPTDTNIR